MTPSLEGEDGSNNILIWCCELSHSTWVENYYASEIFGKVILLIGFFQRLPLAPFDFLSNAGALAVTSTSFIPNTDHHQTSHRLLLWWCSSVWKWRVVLSPESCLASGWNHKFSTSFYVLCIGGRCLL